MTANDHRDSAPKDWLDRLNASPESGWTIFILACLMWIAMYCVIITATGNWGSLVRALIHLLGA